MTTIINFINQKVMYYILTASPKCFIQILDNEEIILSADYTKATQYKRVGDAMKAAVKVNNALGTHLIKFIIVD